MTTDLQEAVGTELRLERVEQFRECAAVPGSGKPQTIWVGRAKCDLLIAHAVGNLT